MQLLWSATLQSVCFSLMSAAQPLHPNLQYVGPSASRTNQAPPEALHSQPLQRTKRDRAPSPALRGRCRQARDGLDQLHRLRGSRQGLDHGADDALSRATRQQRSRILIQHRLLRMVVLSGSVVSRRCAEQTGGNASHGATIFCFDGQVVPAVGVMRGRAHAPRPCNPEAPCIYDSVLGMLVRSGSCAGHWSSKAGSKGSQVNNFGGH